MSAIKRRELKAFLNKLSKDQLIEQIAALCAAVPQAADFYRTKLRAEDDATPPNWRTRTRSYAG